MDKIFFTAFLFVAFTQITALPFKSDLQTTPGAPGATPPNVLLIIADDLSTTLGCYGAKGVITPNLDKFAGQGLRFNRAYCQASLCNPSRASLMTGRRPSQLKILTNQPHFRGIHPKIVTLPEHFKANGYHTVGLGKIFHNWGQALRGDPQSWSEPQTGHWAAHYHDWYVPGRPYQLHFDLKKGAAVQYEDVPDEAYLDGRTANKVINKLRELKETPFFLAVGFWKPHLPYNAPKKYWDLYDPGSLPPVHYPAPVKGVPEMAYVDSDEARSYAGISKSGPIAQAKKRELRHGYLAAISYLDAQVGKILDELDRLDLRKNTIVIFLSDHGYHAGEHGQFGKWTNFEIGTRVPLIISTPNPAEPGTASNSIVELVDLYPTLTNLCSLPPPSGTEKLAGVSLVPLLQNPDVRLKPVAVSQISRPLGAGPDFKVVGSSVRDANFRYTVWVNRKDGSIVAEELYDLSKESWNAQNLSGDSGYREIKNRLYQHLDSVVSNPGLY